MFRSSPIGEYPPIKRQIQSTFVAKVLAMLFFKVLQNYIRQQDAR